MGAQTIEMTQYESFGSYQFIKNEELAFVVITSQILAGSCIHSSTYRHVVFSDCTFYACDFKGVVFENCIFENCTFEFSHIKKSIFYNCNFTDCHWSASTSINSSYQACELGEDLLRMTETNSNQVKKNQSRDYSTDIYVELLAA